MPQISFRALNANYKNVILERNTLITRLFRINFKPVAIVLLFFFLEAASDRYIYADYLEVALI